MSAPSPRLVAKHDVLDRRVLFAVELLDPVAQKLVSRDVEVTADGIANRPAVSASGRFVWFAEGDAWPGAIQVVPRRAPFLRVTVPGPPRPPDILTAPPAARLVRVTLLPTVAYAFGPGVTTVRACLRERTMVPSPPIAGARVQLAWHDLDSGAWIPAPPQPGDPCAQTNEDGECAAFLRLLPGPPADPDLDRGLLKVRLQFTRGTDTRVTPDDFRFLPLAADAGRVPEGRLLPRDVTLGWTELVGV